MSRVVFPLAPPIDAIAALKLKKSSSAAFVGFNEDGGPGLSLMSTSEEAARAYLPFPSPNLQATVNDDGLSSLAAKRRRLETGTAKLPSGPGGEGQDEDDSIAFEPTSIFDETRRVDFLGRSFREPPATGYETSAIPKKQVAALRHKRGVQLVQWFPPVGHLLAAADLDGCVKIWDLSSRKTIVEYLGHKRPVKALQVTSDGRSLSTSSLDGLLRVWDVEQGVVTCTLADERDGSRVPCLQHLHHPSDEQSLILSAVGSKVVLWDLRASRTNVAREYIGHKGSILNLSFLDEGRRLLTTSEDKTLRTWDFRVPVIIKNIAGNAMHAMPHVAHHPSEPMIAAQSFDNKIIVFSDDGGGKVKDVRGREFSGHTVSGTMCEVRFSQDGRFVSSGSVDGSLHVWNWATGKLEKIFKAHSQCLVSHCWHPLFPTMLATSSWDNSIKVWS